MASVLLNFQPIDVNVGEPSRHAMRMAKVAYALDGESGEPRLLGAFQEKGGGGGDRILNGDDEVYVVDVALPPGFRWKMFREGGARRHRTAPTVAASPCELAVRDLGSAGALEAVPPGSRSRYRESRGRH